MMLVVGLIPFAGCAMIGLFGAGISLIVGFTNKDRTQAGLAIIQLMYLQSLSLSAITLVMLASMGVAILIFGNQLPFLR